LVPWAQKRILPRRPPPWQNAFWFFLCLGVAIWPPKVLPLASQMAPMTQDAPRPANRSPKMHPKMQPKTTKTKGAQHAPNWTAPTQSGRHLGRPWRALRDLWQYLGSPGRCGMSWGLGSRKCVSLCSRWIFSQTNEFYYMFLKVPSILTAFFLEELCGPRNPLDGHTNTSRQSRPPEPLRLKTVQ